MDKPLLEVKNLKKYFPITSGVLRTHVGDVKAVDGVDFEVFPNEIVGVVGESGCGKSTLARTVIRLIEPTAGEIKFLGDDVLKMSFQDARKLFKDVQMVFQDPYASLNPRYTIGESIGESLIYHGVMNDKQELRKYVGEILTQIGLNDSAIDRYPHQFSGGQQQRICIGRAIAMQPKLMICDEPVSALDVSIQAQILNLLAELKERMGLSYLFISHDLSVIHHICDRVLVMYRGKIVERGTVKEIFEHPQHPYTQTLLAAVPNRLKR